LSHLSGFNLALNDLVSDESDVFQVVHLNFVQIGCDLSLLPLVVKLGLVLSTLDLFDFLL
jgi:hypothetical protein